MPSKNMSFMLLGGGNAIPASFIPASIKAREDTQVYCKII